MAFVSARCDLRQAEKIDDTQISVCIIAVTHGEKFLDRFDRLFHLRDGRLENDERDQK